MCKSSRQLLELYKSTIMVDMVGGQPVEILQTTCRFYVSSLYIPFVDDKGLRMLIDSTYR